MQTKEDLKNQLDDQLNLLQVLADSYDRGNEIVSKSIATSIRVLVHDTDNSHSLLSLLGIKEQKFTDTAIPLTVCLERLTGSYCALAGLVVGGRNKYIPNYDDTSSRSISFTEYWEGVIFVDKDHNTFSRKDIVLSLANQDGGAHVDPKMDINYKKLAKENSLGWKKSINGRSWVDVNGSVSAAIRQIGHEILRTIKADYPIKKAELVPGETLIGGVQIEDLGLDDREIYKKVGRNEKCPCGSDLKYKKCHGR